MSAIAAFLRGAARSNPREPRPEPGWGSLGREGVRARLAARGFQPDASGLAAVRAEFAWVRDPRELWEAAEARDLLPGPWRGDDRPRFCAAPPAPERAPTVRLGLELASGQEFVVRPGSLVPLRLLDAPADLATALALLADPAGAAHAADLAGEFLARLGPYLPAPARGPYELAFVAFDRDDPDAEARGELRRPWDPLDEVIADLICADDPEALYDFDAVVGDELGELDPAADGPLLRAWAAARGWGSLVAAGQKLRATRRPQFSSRRGDPFGVAPEAVGRRLSRLPDWAAPLLASFLSGWGPVTRQDPDPATGAPGVLVLGTSVEGGP